MQAIQKIFLQSIAGLAIFIISTGAFSLSVINHALVYEQEYSEELGDIVPELKAKLCLNESEKACQGECQGECPSKCESECENESKICYGKCKTSCPNNNEDCVSACEEYCDSEKPICETECESQCKSDYCPAKCERPLFESQFIFGQTISTGIESERTPKDLCLAVKWTSFLIGDDMSDIKAVSYKLNQIRDTAACTIEVVHLVAYLNHIGAEPGFVARATPQCNYTGKCPTGDINGGTPYAANNPLCCPTGHWDIKLKKCMPYLIRDISLPSQD